MFPQPPCSAHNVRVVSAIESLPVTLQSGKYCKARSLPSNVAWIILVTWLSKKVKSRIYQSIRIFVDTRQSVSYSLDGLWICGMICGFCGLIGPES